MSLVIPDEFLQTAHISEADLKLEIAILLFHQEKITLDTAGHFAGINPLEFQQILGRRQMSVHDGAEDFRQDLNRVNKAEVQSSQAEILRRIEQRRTFSPARHHLPDTLTLLQEDRAR